MMPPHYDSLEPEPGQPLIGKTIVFKGYSLCYAEDPVVFDETAEKNVKVKLDLSVEHVGRGLEMDDPPPGSIQEKSVMTIELEKVTKGHTYRVTYLRDSFSWVAA